MRRRSLPLGVNNLSRVRRVLVGVAAAVPLLASACMIPTDQSDAFVLEIVDGVTQLLVGDTLSLATRVTGPSGEVPNATVAFSSSDSTVLVADPSGVLIALGEGRATVTAALVQYQGAPTATRDIYVSRGVVIAELRGISSSPGELRFGESLDILGLRLHPDSLASVTIGSIPVRVDEYEPRDPGDLESLERLRVIVPIAPENSELLIVHKAGGTASRGVVIEQEDFLELAEAPYLVSLADGRFSGEQFTVAWPDMDWYRFDVPAGDWTIELALRSGFPLIRTGQYRFEFREALASPEGFPGWGREQSAYMCDLPGRYAAIWGANRRRGLATLTLPLRLAEATTLDFVASTEWGISVPYRLSLSEGYTAALPPDAAEGNDFCNQAPTLELDGGFVPLNFDTPGDFDWFEVTVPGVPPSFASTSRREVEPNNSIDQAELVTPGTRVIGEKSVLADVDYYAVDLLAGQLLDIDIRSSLLRDPLPGYGELSEMASEVKLFDDAGQMLDQGGWGQNVPVEKRSSGSDASIRYVVPADGRYYISVDGEAGWTNLEDWGDHMHYVMHVWAHELAGSLTVEAVGDGVDPDLFVIAQRATGENVLLGKGDDMDWAETVTVLAHAGRYYVLVFAPDAMPGDYELRSTLSAAPGAGGGR